MFTTSFFLTYFIFITSFKKCAVGIMNPFYLHRAGCHEKQVLHFNDCVQYLSVFIPPYSNLKCPFPQTVIFASDVRISFDRFRNCMTATVISKTIITTNPGKRYLNFFYPFGNDCVSYSNICVFKNENKA